MDDQATRDTERDADLQGQINGVRGASVIGLGAAVISCLLASSVFAQSSVGDGTSGPPPTTVAAAQVKELLSAATAAFQAGQFKRALDEFKEADRASGNSSWEAVVGITSCELQLGWNTKAEGDARRSIALSNNDEQQGLAYHLLGSALVGSNQLEPAEAAFRKALEQRTGRPHRTRVSLAAVLCRLGREHEALGLLDDHGYCTQQELPRLSDREVDEASIRLTAEGEIRAPKKISGPEPSYTAAARRNWIYGDVILYSIIGPDGLVKCVRVLEGLPEGLSCSAAVAAIDWKFEPATLGGVPVEVEYVLTVRFRRQ